MAEVTCLYCGGLMNSGDFNHNPDCPLLKSVYVVSSPQTDEQKIIELLEKVNDKLVQICAELEIIRRRM